MTKLLLVGIDGLRLDLAADHMPTLVDVCARGVVTTMWMDPPTWSGPCWSTLLTGVGTDEHEVLDNSFHGHRLARHPDLLSQAFHADPRRTTFAAAGWGPLVDPAGPGPVIHPRDDQRRAGLHRVLVRDGDTYGFRTVDAEVADFATAGIAHYAPDVSFVYFSEVDEASHVYGARSAQCRTAMQHADDHLAGLIGALRYRAETFGEPWLLAITTDHGHLDEGGHGGAEEIVRRSFVARQPFGAELAEWPDPLPPVELTPRLLAALA